MKPICSKQRFRFLDSNTANKCRYMRPTEFSGFISKWQSSTQGSQVAARCNIQDELGCLAGGHAIDMTEVVTITLNAFFISNSEPSRCNQRIERPSDSIIRNLIDILGRVAFSEREKYNPLDAFWDGDIRGRVA